MDQKETRKAERGSQIVIPRHVYKRLKIEAVTRDRKITELANEFVCAGLGIDPADDTSLTDSSYANN